MPTDDKETKDRTRRKMSKRVVDDAAPGEAQYFIWDLEIKGFALRVMPSGVKSFVFQYRTPEGRSRRATIGRYSHTLTADQARKNAKKLRRAVEDGRDPLGEKRAQRDAMTVGDVLAAYLDSARFAEKAETTRAIDRGRIKRHLEPTLGKKFVDKLTAEDVRYTFAAIRDGKTAADVKTRKRGRAIVRGGEGTARSAIRLLRAIMRWAVSEGLAPSNPADGVSVGSDGARTTILKNAKEYEKLFRTLDDMEKGQRIRQSAADAVRVIALTGARRGEIAGLRWRHVDLKAGILVLPWREHKTGHRTGKPRVIGLPAAAQAIIARQADGDIEDFVFSPAKGEGPLALSRVWRKVREEAELPGDLGLHGLRHSLASHMAMQGAEAAEIMAAMGHRQLSTAQRYVHWAQDAHAATAEKAATHISAALTGALPAKVVKAKRGPHRER